MYHSRGSNLRALHHYTKANTIFEQLNDKNSNCKLLCTIADLLCDLKNYEKAVEYYNSGILLAEEIGDKELHVRCMLHLGNSYIVQLKYEKAVTVFDKCLKLFCTKSSTDDEFTTVAKTCLANLGICYHQLGAFDEALDSFETCLRMMSSPKEDGFEVATVKVHMSCTLLMKQRYSDAIVTGNNNC